MSDGILLMTVEEYLRNVGTMTVSIGVLSWNVTCHATMLRRKTHGVSTEGSSPAGTTRRAEFGLD